jgi:hypothetical protein
VRGIVEDIEEEAERVEQVERGEDIAQVCVVLADV